MDNEKVEANFSPDPLADNPNGAPVDAFVGDAPSSVAAPEAAVSNMDTTVPPATTMPTQGMETNSGWVSNNPSTNQTMSTNDIAFTNNAASMDGGQSKNSKTKLIIIIASVVAVIGIIVAVAVVVMNGQKGGEQNTGQESGGDAVPEVEVISKEALQIYNKASNEINAKLLEDDETDTDTTGREIINLYLEKIKDTENTQAKAMILSDYYQMLMVYQPDMDLKNTVLGGLKMVDDALETVNSATAVVNAAEYYGDTKTVEEYNKLIDERAAQGRYGYYDIDGEDAG